MKTKLLHLFYSIPMLLVVAFPLTAWADSNNPFIQPGQGSSNLNLHGVGDSINALAPKTSFLFSAAFTIMFLIGVVRLGYGIVTKTGHVMKFSTGVLIWVPITFFLTRIFIIFLFTTDTSNATLLASDIINLMKTTGYFISIGMVLVGMVLFLIYRLIQHPEYGRWSKRLWVTAALLSVVVSVIPVVLGVVK